MSKENNKPQIEMEIIQSYGAISDEDASWSKEVNLISWNNKPAKIDIRAWSPGYVKAGKGLALTTDEAKKLKQILNEIPELN